MQLHLICSHLYASTFIVVMFFTVCDSESEEKRGSQVYTPLYNKFVGFLTLKIDALVDKKNQNGQGLKNCVILNSMYVLFLFQKL